MDSQTNPQVEAAKVANLAEDLDVQANKDIAALSYLPPMAIVLFFVKRHSTFVNFHARQAFVLLILAIGFWFVPYVGKFLELFVLLGMSLGFAMAATGKRFELLIIGALSHGKIFRALREFFHAIAEIRHIPAYIKMILATKPLAKSDSVPMLRKTSSTTQS
jgi:uncharacterized membrane protein